MPLLAVAAQPSLLSAFDFVGVQAVAGRRVGSSDIDAVPADAPADPFADLLDDALARVPNLGTDPQPIFRADVPSQVDSAGQLSTGGDAALTDLSARANLIADLQHAWRGTIPTARPAMTSLDGVPAAPAVPADEVKSMLPQAAVPGDAPEPASTVGTHRDGRQSSQQSLSTADDGIDDKVRDAQSTRRVDASHTLQTATVLPTPAGQPHADVEIGESAITTSRQAPQVHAVQAAAGATGAEPTNAGTGVPDASWQSASAVSVHDAGGMRSVTAETPADDAPASEFDRSYDELRPASDFAQDVQTVPQPETPAGSTPTVITIDQPLMALNAAAPAMTPAADSSDLDAQLRPEKELASGSDAVADGTSSAGRVNQVGPAGRSMTGVMTVVSEVDAEQVATLRGVRPSPVAALPAVRTKGGGSEGDGAAATSGESLSATAVDAQLFEPALTGSSVVQQISEAVQTWHAALQEQGTARFSAWLTPPDMGHVWVELTRSAEGITARLSASDDDVQSLLATQEPELRQALADSGIAVNELDVSGRSTGDSASQQQQPPPDRREDSEFPAARAVQQHQRRPAPTRSTAVDVRA